METNSSYVGILRYCAVIFYDGLLLFSVLFLAAGIAYPITDGQVNIMFQVYLLAVSFFYFAWSWVNGGQTLGMKAWRVRLVANDNQPISLKQCLLRFLISIISWLILGVGFFWAFFNQEHRTWHDLLSNTRLIVL
ncbi:RDD family protein [Candidatus Halobeggiatoa sp. HSG11]|nr:RDD family protein [Candidatus Halobeggiatoa sp. HSG11]